MKNHPLIKDTAIFPTIVMEDFITTIKLWIENLLPGGIVTGDQRCGKTLAIKYFVRNSKLLLGDDIPVASFSAWEARPSSETENRFFSGILHALNFAIPHSGTAAVKRQRVLDMITESCKLNNDSRFILFIDEAQWLSNVQLRYLMDIHNQLKLQDLKLITILVGQPELLATKRTLIADGERHIVGRFMTSVYHFRGISSEKELNKILLSFDEKYKSSRGEEIPITQWFLPKAFKNGFRLSPYSHLIWETLKDVFERENITFSNQFPMQPFTALLRWIMINLSELDDDNLDLTGSFITAGIEFVLIQFVDLTR